MTTFLSVKSDTPAMSDLRAWSEEQLIAAAKTGKRAPFGELCERHVKRIFRVIHRVMRNREDAEDALQDRLLNAFTHVVDVDERSRFATWLTSIAINAALSKFRKNHWEREVSVNEPNPRRELERHSEIQHDAPVPEETYRLHERREILNTAILGAGILTQRNSTGSEDLDRSSKSADVSRDSCPASNGATTEFRQIRSGER